MDPVIENPSAIMLAYKYAISAADSAPAYRNLQVALHRWADDPGVGELSSVGTALAHAERMGVGALFLEGVGEVAEAAAIEEAEQETGEQATPEDESYVAWAMAQVRATPEHARDILKWSLENTPSAVAARSVERAVTAYQTAAQEATQKTIDQVKARAQQGADIVQQAYEDAKHMGELGIKAGTSTMLLGAGLAALAAVVIYKTL